MTAQLDHQPVTRRDPRLPATEGGTGPFSQGGRVRWWLAVAVTMALALLPPLILGDPRQQDKVGERPGQASPVADGPQATQPAQESPHVSRDAAGRLEWPRPRSRERQGERDQMVATQIGGGGFYREAVQDPATLAAMRAVPRHAFVSEDEARRAYADSPLAIGYGQTISQPFIVALMTELLQVKPGDKILEIGTGSGYQAAVLSELTPFVYTIEIIEPLQRQAVERFDRLGYRTVQTRLGDGYDGWAEHAPFDGIIVTCAAGHVPPPLWNQLKSGGRMVVPVGGVYETQRLVVLTKQADGRRKSRNVLPVRFVPMTGKIEQP